MDDVKVYLSEHGLSEESYKSLLAECQKKVDGTSLLSWDEICKKYDLDYNADSLRKAAQLPLLGGVFVSKYFEKSEEETPSVDLQMAKRELEIAKRQLYDERNAWRKQNTSQARIEENLSILTDKLAEIAFEPCEDFSSMKLSDVDDGTKEMIICLSDMHIGSEFYSRSGIYNSDIAKERLDAYLNAIIKAGELHGISKVHVVSMGDQISGNIHKSIQLTNRENVIEQMRTAIYYISDFCRSLCKVFKTVTFHSVNGNHTRLDKKEDALNDERLDDLISFCVCEIMKKYSNFWYYDYYQRCDSTVAEFDVADMICVAVHGDLDNNAQGSVLKLCNYLGYKPNIVLKGHMHSPASWEEGGVTVIQSGCLSGSGDEYTNRKRLTGSPSQTILIVSQGTLESIQNVRFE